MEFIFSHERKLKMWTLIGTLFIFLKIILCVSALLACVCLLGDQVSMGTRKGNEVPEAGVMNDYEPHVSTGNLTKVFLKNSKYSSAWSISMLRSKLFLERMREAKRNTQ